MEAIPISSSSPHVAVFGFPFGSHAGPLLSLVQKMAEISPDVTFSFFSTAKSIASIFSNKEKLRNMKAYAVHDGALAEGSEWSGQSVPPLTLFLKALPGNYRRAMEEVVEESGKKVTCLVTDAFYWFGADMAEEMGAKWVPLWTAGPHSLLCHVSTDLLRWRLNWNGGRKDRNLSFISGLSGVAFTDLPDEIISADAGEPFAAMVHKMSQTLLRADAVAINSFDAALPIIVNELHSKFKLLLHVGPLPLTTTPQLKKLPPLSDENGCVEWLDQHDFGSVAYISFGSVVTPPPQEVAALAEAIEESGFPFIWSFRGDPEKQLPFAFLKRTRTKGKSWAPQMQILTHRAVGVFVTHCGWNSILESIVGGVPMICRPFFGDQMLNTRMLETVWGIGLGVENGVFTRKGTLKALEMVLATEEGEAMRQRVVDLQESAMEAYERWGTSTRNFKTLMDIVTT